eukprot:scaffold6436_cov113-Isochrysis_galbana.AAC.3
MRADHKLEVVALEEIRRHVGTEGEADTPFARRAARTRLRVGPKDLRHKTLIRRLAPPVDLPDVVDRHVVARKEAAMHDQHLAT